MKKFFSIFFVNLFFVLAPNLVFAQTSTPVSVREQAMERKEEVKENIAQRVENRCELLTTRIDNKIDTFEANKQDHIDNYNAIKARLENAMITLTEKGYNVSSLQEHVSIWDGMIKEYAVSYQAFIDVLYESKDYACGESEGAFKDAMNRARMQILEARQQRLEIRNYYQTVIREDIKALREQAQNIETTNE